MEAIRMKWYDNLERLLECQVCLDRMEGHICMCQSGHTICGNCSIQITQCGICRKPFTETRNFIAETLSSMIDGIKMSLIHLNFANNIAGTQTDFEPFLSNEQSVTQALDLLPNEIPWGEYPCWLGTKCLVKMTFMEMFRHFTTQHRDDFQEHVGKKLPCTSVWHFTYSLMKRFDRAFFIPKVGIFLLHIGFDNMGQMKAFIAMYDGGRIARQFSYQLEIECGGETYIFMGVVHCSRLAKSSLEAQGFSLTRDHFIITQIMNKKVFKCSVGIQRRVGVTTAQIIAEVSRNSVVRNQQRHQGSIKNSPTQQNDHPQQPEGVNSGGEASGLTKETELPPSQKSSGQARPKPRRFFKEPTGNQTRPDLNDRKNPRKPKEKKSEKKSESSSAHEDLFATLMKLDPQVMEKIRVGLAKIETERSTGN